MPNAMERLLITPVTRIFLPERKPIVPIILSAVRGLVFSLWLLCLGTAFGADKTLRGTFQAGENGVEAVKISDYYSGSVIEAIFDPLLTYDYLARPARLVPNTALSLPEIADGGRTYTWKIKPGIYFAADPAFKGVKRELVAADYAYSIGRFSDPKNRSPYAFLFAGVAAIETPDRYTLRIRLKHTDL